jgi:hypothetical protein
VREARGSATNAAKDTVLNKAAAAAEHKDATERVSRQSTAYNNAVSTRNVSRRRETPQRSGDHLHEAAVVAAMQKGATARIPHTKSGRAAGAAADAAGRAAEAA